MKYIFIAPVHFMEINSTLSKGIQLKDNIRISNNKDFIENLFDTTEIYEWIGNVGYRELKNSTYIYAQGNTADLIEKHGEEWNYLNYCFYFLRESQSFLHDLWHVKDHSSYVRDGFIYVYDETDKNPVELQKASLSQVSSNKSGEVQKTIFSKEEINLAKELYQNSEAYNLSSSRNGGRYPTLNPFGTDLSRIERAEAFVFMARGESVLPLKLINYCTALECLFTSDAAEVSHKMAERASVLFGATKEERINYFKLIKAAYSIRSKLTHGQAVNQKIEKVLETTQSIDELLRKILNEDHQIFLASQEDFESFFNDLLLSREFG
ncbi:HEPN domain-containing protein [Planococcus wigleyi]|uniref:Apea-like HEPN domain-containing protein n=1 Tax=Planococcus wigleyi TaxID=2762216 RepID=A0ABR8WDH0_9BACL|nr:HEPN domain-containing protein [Planococcus wigleyi]MBD8015054.1 hypothetical protein [Planococcus wigleyi]